MQPRRQVFVGDRRRLWGSAETLHLLKWVPSSSLSLIGGLRFSLSFPLNIPMLSGSAGQRPGDRSASVPFAEGQVSVGTVQAGAICAALKAEAGSLHGPFASPVPPVVVL